MSKLIACSLVIKDDFNNVLLLKRKVKRGQKEEWSLLNHKARGKEIAEKCVNRGVKDILKSVVFDLKSEKEYIVDNENDESVMVFTGALKERITLDKNYKEYKWVNSSDLNNYEMNEFDRQILDDFFR